MTGSNNIEIWADSKLLNELNVVARKFLFDWNKISHHLASFIANEGISVDDISPASCRTQFAACNSVVLPTDGSISGNQNQVTVSTTTVTDNLVKSEDKPKEPNPYEHYTLEELMAHVEKNEEIMKKRKEEIFQRVLDSLGGEAETVTLLADPAISAYQEAIHAKQEKEKARLLKQQELQEKEKLDKEREQLKKRFDPDSEDAIGYYPEFTTLETNQKQDLAFAEQHDASSTESLNPVSNFLNSFSIENFIQGEEFDRILSELEKELDSQAVGKDDGEVSELGEILAFLDQSAKQRLSKETMKAKDYDKENRFFEESQKLADEFNKVFPKSTQSKESEKLSKDIEEKLATPQLPEPPTSTAQRSAAILQNPKQPSNDKPAADSAYRGRMVRSERPKSDSDSDEDSEEDDQANWKNCRNMMKAKAVETIKQEGGDLVLDRSTAIPQHTTFFIPAHNRSVAAPAVNGSTQVNTAASILPPSPPSPSEEIVCRGSVVEEQPLPPVVSENVEILEKVESLIEEIMPAISVEAVPDASGSLLSAASSRKSKGKPNFGKKRP